jgi:hypothetical protein
MKPLKTAAEPPGGRADEPPEVPAWVRDVLEALALNSLTKFTLLCHLHDHRGRKFEPPQLPTWSLPREGIIRSTLDELVARGVLLRYSGRHDLSYTYGPEEEKGRRLERFFAFLGDAWCRARVLRWILAAHQVAPSPTEGTGRT